MNNFLNSFYWWKKLLSITNFNRDMFFNSINKGWHDINFENYYGKEVEPMKVYLSADQFDAFCELMEKTPEPNDRLLEILSTPAPWERTDD